MDNNHYSEKKGAEAVFKIVMEGIKGQVDGGAFWDTVAEDAVFDFRQHCPGFTSRVGSRDAYKNWCDKYSMILHSADNLRVYKVEGNSVIILEYEVHGIAPSTGKVYDNRFCSIVTIKDRKIVYWRDYMDSLAAMLVSS